MTEKQFIQDLLPAFFEGTLDNVNQKKVEVWKTESKKNQTIFNETFRVWEKTERLRLMQKYNAQKALENVNKKIEQKGNFQFLKHFQRVAAILILPLLISTLYFFYKEIKSKTTETEWNTLKTGAGMRSEFVLPDGTKVFLNSNTTLSYPVTFTGLTRDVRLLGEAYFEVAENKKKPFILNTGKIHVEVVGTEFKASNFASEKLTEIVLVEGSVNLCQYNSLGQRNVLQVMNPGEKAILNENDNRLYIENVDVLKYIAWKEGKLIFRDDTMKEVVRRLNRWYNVDIKLIGNELEDYTYTATFEDESLTQVLDLLKLSAPIDSKIVQRKRKNDNSFSKMKIEIIQQ